MKLWLDDIRTAPAGWTHARSVNQAIAAIGAAENFCEASLDHDLGDYYLDGGDGRRLVYWMILTDSWPHHKPTVHSMNPVGVYIMRQDIERHWHESK